MRLLDAALVAAEVHGAQAFGGNFAQWCRVNGISRATAYRHRKRVAAQGMWTPQTRRPASSPNATPPQVVDAIVRVRGQLPPHENGAEQIRYALTIEAAEQGWDAKGWWVPVRSTIHRLLVAADLVVPEPRKRPRSSFRRFAYARPRDCYQIDATEVSIPSMPGPAVVFEVLDDHTRMLVATHVTDRENTTGAVTALRAAFTDHGVPALVLADNGLAFSARFTPSGTTRFTRLVSDHGARLIHSSPYHPQTCGKVERHHRTFKNWLATQPPPSTPTELQHLARTYQHWYNTTRRHSAHNAPPATAWDRAPILGGPEHLPVQQDAHVQVRKVSATGAITIRSRQITIGLPHAGQTVTTLLDGDHLTVYSATGQPLGHLPLDHTKRHQGKLRAA